VFISFEAIEKHESGNLIHVIDETDAGAVSGLAVMCTELFVVRKRSSPIFVYDAGSLIEKRRIHIPNSNILWSLAVCLKSKSLFVSDLDQKLIYRYQLVGNCISSWSIEKQCNELSITKNCNVLVTLFAFPEIQEYSPEGKLLRTIALDLSIDKALQSIQLYDEQFLIIHHGETQHRVCILDQKGCISLSYGGVMGSRVGSLHDPSHIVVDAVGHVLVADNYNSRVVLLSPTLAHLGYLQTPGTTLNLPSVLYLDECNNHLYIGERGGQRVLVLHVDMNKISSHFIHDISGNVLVE